MVNWARGARGTRLPVMPVRRGGAPVISEAKPGAVFNQLGEIGQFPLPYHFQREGGDCAVPGEHDCFGGALSENRARRDVENDGERDQ